MATKPPRNKGSKLRNRKASLGSSPNINREPKISFQQRINPVYLREESQIQKLIEPRQDRIHERTQSDLEVQFFTDSVTNKNLDLPENDGSNSSLKSLQSNEFQTPEPHFLDSIVQIEGDKLFERVKEDMERASNELYYPSTNKPSINVVDKETTTLSSQGLHDPPLPANIKERNKNLLYNRLLEEDKTHLFNSSGELIGLQEQKPHSNKLLRFESHKEFPIKFILIDEEQLNTADQLEETSVLVIQISRLIFQHHHLFSEEEFLAKSIEKSYKGYSNSKKCGAIEKLMQRIAFIKNAISEMKKDSEEYKKSLSDILELRNKYHLEKKTTNDRVQNILQEYKALKTIRKAQQFNSTTLKLIISVDETGLNDQSRFLEYLLEEEIQETFELETIEYQDIKKDRKQRRKSLAPEESENLPVVPPKPNLDKIKSKLRKKFKDCHFDLEGQSGVDLRMTKIPKTQNPSNIGERKRISAISGLKFQLKVFCNNESIGVINPNSISEDFEVNFHSSISLRLTNRLPDQIRIDLVEQRPLKPKMRLSKISVPVPRFHQGSIDDTCGYSSLEFTSQKSVQSDVGIGSGQFCIRKNHQQFISGSLAIKIGWREFGPSTAFPPVQRLPRIMSDDSQFDPMNPDIDRPIPARGNPVEERDDGDEQEEEEEEEEQFFFNEDELAFCSVEEFKNNPRNRILSERAKNNLKYKDLKLVPCNARQIEDTELPAKLIDETLGMDPIDLQRYKGKRYLMDVYSKISNYCRSLNEEFDEDQLLMENMPTLASMVTRFFQLFGPNRPLKPARRQPGAPHRLSSRNIDVSQFNVSLNIVRAFGIPHRQDDSQVNVRKSSNMSSPKDPGFRPINIRPFVTASFKDISVRTSTGDGSNPTWNEQMTIPLK